MTTDSFETQGVRVAIEGCGHGTLDAIYATVAESCERRGWDGVDVVIIGGDFQAVRNSSDLNVMACPVKYRQLGDFHKYYSGETTAPYLTIFIAGNHEASSHLWELYYGGWVAPNIYYLGAANILRLGPLRIAGLSGIWKGFDYRKPHHERLPFSDDDVRSWYHVREYDVRKLLLVQTQVDVGMSHDWPRGIEKHGDAEWLFKRKNLFRQESNDGTLGSVAAEYVMDRLRPAHWFSAHLHIKFSALKSYNDNGSTRAAIETPQQEAGPSIPVVQESNPDEIDLDMDDDDDQEIKPEAVKPEAKTEEPPKEETNEVSEDLRAQLPASFARPPPRPKGTPGQPVPPGITNKEVRFLALDKCLPRRHFLQLCEIQPLKPADATEHPPSDKSPRYRLQYDPEWLAITRVFHGSLVVGDRTVQTPPDLGEEHYLPLIEAERAWVDANVVQKGKLDVPENFELTAPIYESGMPTTVHEQPEEYTNPQTSTFCSLLSIANLWDDRVEEEEVAVGEGEVTEEEAVVGEKRSLSSVDIVFNRHHHGPVLDNRVSLSDLVAAAMFRYLSPNSLSTMTQLESTILPVSLSTDHIARVLDLAVANVEILEDRNQRTRNQFRPRVGKGGAASYQLRQYAEVTLGGGSLRKVVKLPEGEDENEWLAVNMVDFYNQINLLYGAITEFCSPQSCPEMKATDEFEYLWQDSENYKRPTKMPAPSYIEQLMTWVQANIDNEQILPSKIGVPFPKSFPALVRQIFKRMYRVYAHIYCHHYPVIRELGLEPHLNTSFKQHQHPKIAESSNLDIWIENPELRSTASRKPSSRNAARRPRFNSPLLPPAANTMFSRQVLRSARAAAPLALRAAPARTYAAAAATEAVKAPAAVFGVDGTYATALYTAAVKTSNLEPTAKALANLGSLFQKDPKLTKILSTPTLSEADKASIVEELAKHTGNAGGATIKNFLDTLAENNRLGLLNGITEKFNIIMATARGEVEMTVTSASQLDSRTLNRLESAVAKSAYVGQGKKLKVKNTINPDIVGGLVVEIGDRTIDLSVSSRIAKMNKLLTEAL
ncbi:hypothetical protein G7046_g5052 [Stylonectria norvegica]|nr:hypothetical protein G7046_g5052 [Stylonectria norvegica]